MCEVRDRDHPLARARGSRPGLQTVSSRSLAFAASEKNRKSIKENDRKGLRSVTDDTGFLSFGLRAARIRYRNLDNVRAEGDQFQGQFNLDRKRMTGQRQFSEHLSANGLLTCFDVSEMHSA